MKSPIRRVISPDAFKQAARPDRLSVMDKRHAIQSAQEIEDREAHEQTASAYELNFERNDRKDVQLDEIQQNAVNMFLENQYATLNGYAGTGKTTSVKGALTKMAAQVRRIDWESFRSVGRVSGKTPRPAIALCCLANIAARNLASKLPEEWAPHCMSLHSLLAFAPVGDDGEFMDHGRGRFEPRYNSTNPLPIDAIFVDEAGTMPAELWHMMLDACPPHVRIYLLGDMAQNPAMTSASPMPFTVSAWPTMTLDKIYRQADGSKLLEGITAIRRGIHPTHDGATFRCGEFEKLPSSPTQAQRHIAAYIKHMHKLGIWDPAQDMIITPQNKTDLGQIAWNSAFRYSFNPPVKGPDGAYINPPVLMRTALGPTKFAVGDKVMATDNSGRLATEKRFVNGSIGTITRIRPNPNYKGSMDGLGEESIPDFSDFSDTPEMTFDNTDALETAVVLHERDEENAELKLRASSHIITVTEAATGEEYELNRSVEIATLSHAYAVTGHKFQGSQARNVLVICHRSMNFGLNREWVYTAASRAQKACILMHEPVALDTALGRQQLLGRNPQEKAEHLISMYEKRRMNPPKIPRASRLNLE